MTISNRDYEKVVEDLFAAWFAKLYAYAFSILREETMAEEMVRIASCHVWERQDQLQVHTSLKAYLFRSVHPECIDALIRNGKRDAAMAMYEKSIRRDPAHQGGESAMAMKLAEKGKAK